VELLDEVQIKAINMANGKNFPEVPTLMFEFIGIGNATYYMISYIMYPWWLYLSLPNDFI
jgi:hypothetical protein